MRYVDYDVDALDVEPASSDVGADIHFQLAIGVDQLDRSAQRLAARVFDGHFHALEESGAADARKSRRVIAEHADLYGGLRRGRRSANHRKLRCQGSEAR